MLRSNLCDYSDAYIVMKARIIVRITNNSNIRNKTLTFKNNAPFRSCISKVKNTFIDSAEDLNIVMLMYSLIEYSDNYSKTFGSLWNYNGDEVNDSANENHDANNYRINNNKTTTSKSCEYKTKIIERTPSDNNILDKEVDFPLKYLNNFWRSLVLPLINCEIELYLLWSIYCIISEISKTHLLLP